MNICNFEPIDNLLYKCNVCEYVTKYKNLQRECKKLVKPSLPKKLANFSSALSNHIQTGAEMVGQDTLRERLKICEECPLFKRNESAKVGGICTHSSCGCNIRDEITFLNKIAWAEQKCPIDRWGPVSKNDLEIKESGV